MRAIINIKKNGFHIFRSVFDKKFISILSDSIKKQKPSPQAGFYNNQKLDSKAILNLQSKDKIFLKLLNHKLITKINTFFLNDKYYKSLNSKLPNYILSQFAARSTGKKKLVLHIDDKVPNKSQTVNYLQWAIPLVNLNKDNGYTQVVPKSHRSGILKPVLKRNDKLKDLKLNVGDVVVWDGRIWHAARENKTNKDRWVIIITFCKWFFKPHYDIPRNFPKKFYKNLTRDLKIILGFASIPKLNEKSGNIQRGDLRSASNFISKGIY